MPVSSTSLGKTLRPLSACLRSKARALYLARCQGGPLDRALLEQVLFELQEEIEWGPSYQAGGDTFQRLRPTVETLTAVRGVLLDDLGVNEGGTRRWPRVDQVAAIMREKRRAAPSHGFTPAKTKAAREPKEEDDREVVDRSA